MTSADPSESSRHGYPEGPSVEDMVLLPVLKTRHYLKG